MLRTERDVVRTLAGTLTLGQLYEQVEAAGVTGRDRGDDVIHGVDDRRWKRRVRCALQDLRRQGLAERVGRATWVIGSGTVERPLSLLLLVPDRDIERFELAVAEAAEWLTGLADDGTIVDLLIGDPPYALKRGHADAGYRRTYEHGATRDARTVGGYVEVDADRYPEFTRRWVTAAAGLLELRPGGYLAAITGPQQAARVQIEAEAAGLTYVNQIVADKPFALRTTRRFAHAHYVVTVLCSGPLDSNRRTFNPPDDQLARSGRLYPLDFWTGTERPDRPGLLTYDNTLPVSLCRRVIDTFTNPGDLVADPFLGGGSTAVAAYEARRAFTGADLNPNAVRFSAARLLEEHVAIPALF